MKSDKEKKDSKDEDQKSDKEKTDFPDWNLDLPDWNIELPEFEDNLSNLDDKLADWNPDIPNLDNIIESMPDWNPDFLIEGLSEFEVDWDTVNLEPKDFTFEENLPEPDTNLTEKDVAAWMLSEVEKNGTLYQNQAVFHISRHFGKRFVYQNKNGNLAIEKSVLDEFLIVSIETVVWVKGKRFWRMRQPSDPKNQREVKY